MSAFCSGLCNEISRCCYDFYHAPFTKKNLLIGGGILLGIIIIIIIIVCATGTGHHGPSSGSAIIKTHPLIDGANSLSKNLKNLFMDKINEMNDQLSNNLYDFYKNHSCKSCQTDFNRLKLGLVATQVFSLTTSCSAEYKDSVSQTLEQIDLLKRIIANPHNKVALVKDASDIAKHFDNKVTGIILSVWGGHNIDSRLAVLRMYYDLGVRIMSLVSVEDTKIRCPPPWIGSNESLTDFGKKVINEMNRLGMIIDLTGSSMATQQSVLEYTKAPAIFSHSGSATITPSILNVDDQILENKKTKIGLVMVPFTPRQLSSSVSTIANISSHLTALSKYLTKSKLGIGSNFDNMVNTTEKLDDVSKFPILFDYLWNNKWGEKDIKDLASQNFVNVFKEVEKVSKNMTKIKNIPDDSIIEKTYLEHNMSCYSDFSIRYNPTVPTAKPTQPPTTPTKNSTSPKPKKGEH